MHIFIFCGWYPDKDLILLLVIVIDYKLLMAVV